VEHYHAFIGQFIIGAVFKKGTRRDPDSLPWSVVGATMTPAQLS
jgi:hypothetical protein